MRISALILILLALGISVNGQTSIFTEIFSESNGSTSGSSSEGVGWMTSCPTCIPPNDYLQVENGAMENQDSNGPAVFETASIDVSNCSSVRISFEFEFSFDWIGSGDSMESSDECPPVGGGNCTGDPNNPLASDCEFCWDFLWAQLLLDGADVSNELIGEEGTLDSEQMGTINLSACTNGASNLVFKTTTQTWAGDETVIIDNIVITCWENDPILEIAGDDGSGGPIEFCEGDILDLEELNVLPSKLSSPEYDFVGPNSGQSGPSNTLSIPSVTSADGGTYTVTTTDDNGCTATDDIEVSVNPSTTGTFTSTSEEICVGECVDLEINFLNPDPNHEVTFGGSLCGISLPVTSVLNFASGETTLTVCLDNNNTGFFTPFDWNDATNTVEVWSGLTALCSTGSLFVSEVQNATGCVETTDSPSISLTLTEPEEPNFTQLGPYCQGETPDDLPTSSTDVPPITGSWNGPINTGSVGSVTYTFTPDPNQCAESTTMEITIDPSTPSTFNALPSQCADGTDPLPATSLEGFTGMWSPSFDPNTTTSYTFTPDAGQCATDGMLTVTIDPLVIPNFNQLGDYCVDDTPDVLPTTSSNNITGTWNGPIDTSTPGTITYTFTPNADQCAENATMMITINSCGCANPATVSVDPILPICEGETIDLTAIIGGGATMVTWNTSGDGSFDNITDQNPTYTPGANDILNGSVILTVTTDDPDGMLLACNEAMANIQVDITQEETPLFAQLGAYCVGDVPDVLPTNSTNGITGMWNSPISTSAIGTTTYFFTSDAGQCAEDASMMVTIDAETPATFNALASQCVGESDPLPSMSLEGFTGMWSPSFDPNTTTTYTFTPDAGQCASVGMLTVTIDAETPSTFNSLPSQCAGESDPLPATSLEGFTGSWSPAFDPNTTTTYTFIPDAGQCASDGMLTITIDPATAATFNGLPSQCAGEGNPLPTTSLEGFLGIWTPAFDPNATMTYTFIPNAGQCASDGILTITVDPLIIPSFTQLGDYCVGDTPDMLPTTSTNGITGSWDGPIDTSSPSSTSYTFMPDAGQCADQGTMLITVNDCGCTDPATIAINSIFPICENENIDLVAILGGSATMITWTSTGDGSFSNINDLTPTYTPGANDILGGSVVLTATTDDPDGALPSCSAVEATVQLLIDLQQASNFAQLGPYCVGDTPDVLPMVSINGISGSWDGPISTNTAGDITYTFTPDNGQCAQDATMMISVIECGCADPALLSITGILPICENETIQLTGGLDGSSSSAIWTTNGDGVFMDPADPQTIYTPGVGDIANGTILLTLTSNDPDGAGPCEPAEIGVNVSIEEIMVSTFDALASQCLGGNDPLPTMSLEGFTGSWSPAFDPNASATYTFTPDAGQCADTGMLTVTIDAPIVSSFNTLPSQCAGESNPLPLTSLEGFVGSWSPAFDPNITATYTFAPDMGQCALEGMLTVEIDPLITATFDGIPNQCIGESNPLPATSLEGFTGSWNPPFDTNNTTTYTFTPDIGQCAAEGMLMVTVDQLTVPDFAQLGPYCVGDTPDVLAGTSSNGITGVWDAAITTDTPGSITYLFMPDDGQCADDASMTIIVNDCGCADPASVSIDPVDWICQNELIDLNAVLSGSASSVTWTTLGQGNFTNTTALSTTYLISGFDIQNGQVTLMATTNDPDGSGPCAAAVAEMTVEIRQLIEPEFTQLGTYCVGETPDVLPTTSLNGITGSWNGPIDTSMPGVPSYLFVADPGQCAESYQMSIAILECDCMDPPTISINDINPICEGESIDLMAVIGGGASMVSWVSAGDGNFSNISAQNPTYTPGPNDIVNGSVVLTATTDDPDGALTNCMEESAMVQVEVTPQELPQFVQLGPYCIGDTPDALSMTSTNGIIGTWDGPIETISEGSTIYTFVPTMGQCATETTMAIMVNNCSADCEIFIENCPPNLGNPNCGSGEISNIGVVGGDEIAANGEQVCLDITLSNVMDLQSFTLEINWDETLLSYSGTQNFSTEFFTFGANSIGDVNASTGVLTAIWFDPTGAQPVTLNNDEVIFELCFDVIGTNGSFADVSFGFVEFGDGMSMPLDFFTDCGSVDICAGSTILEVVCSDNGTPDINDDDSFSFELLVNNGGNAGSWIANDPNSTSQQYGVVQTFGPFLISDGGFLLTIQDLLDPSCFDQIQIDPPMTCSEDACMIDSPQLADVICNDNGTIGVPEDDFVTFTLNPTGAGLSGNYILDPPVATPAGGAYGMPTTFTMPQGSADGSTPTLFVIQDAIDTDCIINVSFVNPPSCSTDCSDAPTAGTGIDTIFCGRDDEFNLFELLNSYDPGGLWTLGTATLTSSVINLGALGENTFTYTYTVANGSNCENSVSVQIINEKNIIIDDLTLSECDFVILPEITGTNLTDVNYYSSQFGQGQIYLPGDTLFETTALFMYDEFDQCIGTNTAFINIEIPDIDNPSPVLECEYYVLPEITGEFFTTSVGYFSEPNGMGQTYSPGDTIFSFTEIYMYHNDGECFDEELLSITIVSGNEFVLDSAICPGDEIIVNGNVYNETNLVGEEVLSSSIGCDSLVVIDLQLLQNPEGLLNTSICEGDNFAFGGVVFDENNTSQQVTLSNMATNGCDSLVNVTVEVLTNQMSVFDTLLCQGESFTLGGITFSESNLSGEVMLEGMASNGCDSIISVTANFEDPDFSFLLTPLEDMIAQQLVIDLNITPMDLLWEPAVGLSCDDCLNPIVTINADQDYTLTVTYGNGCEFVIPFSIESIRELFYYIPNAISPNKDGFNDVFFIQGLSDVARVDEIAVYDRWGELVFSNSDTALNDPDQGWNGKFKKQYVVPGVYAYYVRIIEGDNTALEFTGDLTVFR